MLRSEAYARLKHSTLSVVGFTIVTFLFILAIVGPYIVPYDVALANPSARFIAPSQIHFFGTDELGRDVFSRVIAGVRVSLYSGFLILLIAICIGVPVGAISGYMGGAVDQVIMRITDIFLSVPLVLWALAVAISLGGGLEMTIIAISTKWWTSYTRLARERFLALKQEKFAEAAKASGISDSRIIIRHLLPNSLTPIIVNASMQIGDAIIYVASLSFLGVGARPPTPEWGLMLQTARMYLPAVWWYSFFPGLFMSVAILGFNLVGDGLRDILDPKFKGRIAY